MTSGATRPNASRTDAVRPDAIRPDATLSRRGCLGLAVASACATVAGQGGQQALARLPVAPDLGNLHHLRQVGRAAVRSGIVPPDLEHVRDRLRRTSHSMDLVGFDTDHAGRAELAQAIRSDFDAGRTVRLDGWVLSDTEVLLAAAAYLAT